jgi:hypothetical protein
MAEAEAVYRVTTVCECQALLAAELDAQREVVRASTSRLETRQVAPANSVGADKPLFDVVWRCTICGRNTLRTFHTSALSPM